MNTIKQNNELIAEFLGYSRPHPEYPNSSYWYKEGCETLVILAFDSSWNWLMGAVTKCSQIEAELNEIVSDEIILPIYSSLCNTDIMRTHESVVRFINWYNENKKTKEVQVTLSRQYYKEVTINVNVPQDLNYDELRDFLSTDKDIHERLENELGKSSLCEGDDEYTFYDEQSSFGGHL
jgi:hypothetical protein